MLHSLPIGYSLDGDRGIRDPRGMLGETLGVDMHVVTADEAPLSNLELAINRCHLSVETVVATPYASGLAALVDDEAELGCACIDLGGGTTTLSVFNNGEFVHADAIAVGGQHMTHDIARGLSTDLADAERIKTLHGSALPSPPTTRDPDDPAGRRGRARPSEHGAALGAHPHHPPRVEEILELMRDRLTPPASPASRTRVVLTGGASQLTGVVEAARRVLGAQRPARPAARHCRACRRRPRARPSRRRSAS